jgi:hypothetical protein
MAFTDQQTGLERGATQLLLDVPPRVMNRHQEGGPQRAATRALTGHPIGVEFTQVNNDPVETWGMETLTEAQAETLRTLLDSAGPLTAKPTRGTSDTFTAIFGPNWILEPIIGPYTNTAPSTIRYYRARVELLKQ